MRFQNRQAFSLIELLIVVAIIAILAAGTISFITVPPREQLQATTDMENEMGLSIFFAKLVADAHNATRLTTAHNNRTLILEESGQDASAVYFVDGKKCLRRGLLTRQQAAELAQRTDDWQTAIPSNLLVENVRRLEAVPVENSGMWRIGVSLASRDPLHPTLDRFLDLLVRNTAARSEGEIK